MPADHARVKQVFLAAIDLPSEERVAFVARECGDDADLRNDVDALLAHHSEKTLLSPDSEAKKSLRPLLTNVRAQLPKLPAAAHESSEREIARETKSLLRNRLMIVTLVFAIGIGLGALLALTGFRRISMIAPLLAAAALLASYAYMYFDKEISVFRLRLVELLLLVTAALLTIYTDWFQLHHAANLAKAAADPNAADPIANTQWMIEAVSANNWVYLTWSLVIFVYGVFMPNTWRRAAMILVPAAFFPHLTTVVAIFSNPNVAQILTFDHYIDSIMAPLIAAGASIYAAHIIHQVRLDAIRARRLAQYQIIRRIGVGGMGEVFEAQHMLLKRNCAMKLLRAEFNANAKTLARFEREVKATAALTHPNTVEIFDFGRTADGDFYYVMELLPGRNLQELVSTFGPLTPGRTVFLLRQACSALQEAHEEGLIHRDIKPGNVFASERGGLFDFIKLLDFGMVRETKLKSDLTGVNMIGGTPLYMAPEQALNTSQADAVSDIYGMGAVAYFLLTGQPPFPEKSLAEILIAHAKQKPTPPSELQPSVPRDLEQVVLRCLEKDPADRYQDAAALEAALNACESGGQWTRDDARRWWSEQDESLLAPQMDQPTQER